MKAVYKVPKGWVAIPVPKDVLMEAYGALAPVLARSRHTGTTTAPLDLPRPRKQKTHPPKVLYCSHCGHSPKSHQHGSCDVCGDRDTGAGPMYSGHCPGWNGEPGARGEFVPRQVDQATAKQERPFE